MNLYFRVVWLLLRRIFIPRKISAFDPCLTSFWVNPFDLDINLHMNNGRYLSIMDLGRIDLLLKAKSFWKLLLNGYYPVVASEGIRFKKALMPFQFFQIRTQIDCWNEKDFYIKQEFLQNSSIIAEGYIKARFLKRGHGSISTKELFQILGLEYKDSLISHKALALDELHSNLTKSI